MTEAAKKTAKPKAAAKPAAAKTAKPVQKDVAGAKVKVTQTTGCIARRWDQEATLIGLGLNKRHRSRVLEDTACVRGMINKVRHLVTVEKVG
jgi:large subunit ribosomal protein L30